MKRAFTTLAAWSLLALPLVAGSAFAGRPQPAFDHLKCFQIKDDLQPRQVLTADLFPEQAAQFADQTCRVRLPASHFCIDVAKSDVRDRNGQPFPTIPIAGTDTRDYLCYDLKCAKELPTIDAADQFGRRVVRVKSSQYLCTPAEKVLGVEN